MAHHRCNLHDNERITKCAGTLRRGGICVNNAAWPSTPGVMPTCKIHRGQQKIPAWCKAVMPCGFECGRLFEWKPHGFQLCPYHLEDSMTCYFFRIHIEIRCYIYRFLFPDIIPPRYGASSLTTNKGKVYTAILRVNRQIHEEAANLLYCTRLFTIEVSENALSLCNLPNKYIQYIHYDSYYGHIVQHRIQSQFFDRMSPPTVTQPVEPVWNPPLSERYFTRIQSFRIELWFHYPTNYKPPGSSASDTEKQTVLGFRLSRYCDQLHRLIGRLQLRQTPIAYLEIAIKFCTLEPTTPMEAFSAALALLNPFRRLCKVAKPQVLSVTINNSQSREITVLFPDQISSVASRDFTNHLKSWSKDLSSSQASFEGSQVLEAYWRLENLVSRIKDHCNSEPRFFQFAGLLQAARIARETNNLGAFRKYWDMVVAIWLEYLDHQNNFQSNVTRSINVICDIVERGS